MFCECTARDESDRAPGGPDGLIASNALAGANSDPRFRGTDHGVSAGGSRIPASGLCIGALMGLVAGAAPGQAVSMQFRERQVVRPLLFILQPCNRRE